MKAESWKRIEKIVDELLCLPAGERRAAAEERCSADNDLLDEVLEFLQSIEESDHLFENLVQSKSKFLEQYQADLVKQSDENHFIGRVFNNYKIVSHIETGGMGAVYLAERCDGTFDKKAAIKILKRDFVVPGSKEHFKQEMQILANLTHPGIAKIYDGGVYEGLPYIIMEYVEGNSILDYCNEHKCSISDRLRLFINVLEIVENAHANLVVHRDLKPENILVDRNGKIKILDFGISKLEKQTALETGEHTRPNFLTPLFASPEQFSGGHDNTLTDIYSLGILLNELISGTVLFNTVNKQLSEIKQEKLSGVKFKPSVLFNQLSYEERIKICEQRNVQPKRLLSILKHDIDYIILKATEPLQKNRYASAGLLLIDLKKYQRTKPVSARKRSLSYVSGKYIKRNQKLILSALSIFIFLAITAFLTTSQIQNERLTALYEKENANEITLFLMGLFDASNPISVNGDTVSAASILSIGMDRIETVNNLETRVKLLGVMGNAFKKLSEFENARFVLNRAAEESTIAFGSDHLITADIYYQIGSLYIENYTWQHAIPNIMQAYNIYSIHLPDEDLRMISSLSKLGRSYGNLGLRDSSLYYSEKAYAILNNRITPEMSLDVMDDYAMHLTLKNEFSEAENVYKQMEEYIIKNFGSHDYRLISIYNRLGLLFRNQELFTDAETYYKHALELSEVLYGFDHLTTTRIRSNLAPTLVFLEKIEEAESILHTNLKAYQSRFTENHWRTGSAYGAIANFLASIENFTDSHHYFEQMLLNFQKNIGYEHSWTSYAEGAFAAVNRHLGNYGVADSLYQKNIQFLRELYPAFTPDNRNQIERIINIYSSDAEKYEYEISNYLSLLNGEDSESVDD
ncbi:MAG: serine/threonine protein kinase [Balneolaceae bacterium]|nr:serine/threonine protein kinase [Balneolaceae bacterium]